MSRKRRAAWGLAAAFAVAAAWVAATPLPEELRRSHAEPSLRVVDTNERLLRDVRASDGARARFASLAELGPNAKNAILAAEDRRFFAHPGVDPLALTRAVLGAVRHLRVVSGGSTITMQLARTLRPHPRTVFGKVREMVLALRIEASLSKSQILQEYLNRVSFGPNLRGYAAASHAYFGKTPGNLSVAEAAFIAGLPQSPSRYSLERNRRAAEARRNRVIARMLEMSVIDAELAKRAQAEPLRPGSLRPAFGAPHLVQGLVNGGLWSFQPGLREVLRKPASQLTTTLDATLQVEAETAVSTALSALSAKQATAGSVVVLDNSSGDVLAYVGSPDFFDEARLGQNDGARALRQPGSTLKPFLYALAMEKLGFTAATALPDVESHFATKGGRFSPRNYDSKVRGPVRLREALGNSLNIPAVWTLSQLGVEPFFARLRELGFDSLVEAPDYYGLALALGDGEVRLLDLAAAYATLARGGVYKPSRLVRGVERVGEPPVELAPAEGRRVIPALIAAQLTDILSDPRARSAAFGAHTLLDFPFPVAAKTGTSKGFRDNWVIGYTHAVTVAVWVGNFDGGAMENVSGIAGAGPIFHSVMEAAMRRSNARDASSPLTLSEGAPREGLHRVEICSLSGGLASVDCPHKIREWVADDAVLSSCDMHERVRLNRQDGLRAGSTCARDEVVERTFERFPPEYLAWATAASRPLAPRDFSPMCPDAPHPVEPREAAIRILYPADGARFAIDPERPASVQLLSVPLAVPEGTREAALLVDGEVVDTVHAPFVAQWLLVPG
ncbi:MAG TPA: penicillin-binding protein 1C, partial [Polyangiaceae bacterium]|nr:penicillin-binding protein 1C [Polyangiaceae bacterium]